MNTPTKPRGRPVGSGKDDNTMLDEVADELAAHRMLAPMTAMRIVAIRRGIEEHNLLSAVRRFHRKWKKEGEARMRLAEKRHSAKQFAANMRSIEEMMQKVEEFRQSPVGRKWAQAAVDFAEWGQSFAHSPLMQAIDDMWGKNRHPLGLPNHTIDTDTTPGS